MINGLIDSYKKFRRKTIKKGYEVIGYSKAVLYFIVLFSTYINFFAIFKISYWLIIIEILLISWLRVISKQIDFTFKHSWLKDEMKLKQYVKLFLLNTGFNSSEQYKYVSSILKDKSNQKYKKYDLNAPLAIIVTILIFVLGLIVDEAIKPLIIIIALGVIILFIITITFINTLSKEILNKESDILLELAELVDEIYLEKSIDENMKE